jgi:hypothetical protein
MTPLQRFGYQKSESYVESFSDPEGAREWASKKLHSVDLEDLSIAGTVFRILKEMTLADACFWTIEQKIDKHGPASVYDRVRLRYIEWLFAEGRLQEAEELLQTPVRSDIEPERLELVQRFDRLV